MGASVVAIISLIFVFTLIAAARGKSRVSRAQGLEAVRMALESAVTATGGDVVTGLARGLAVKWHYTTRGAGSSSVAWTDCDVTLRHQAPLALQLRTQTRAEEDLAASGLVVDLVLGDEAFDAQFIVEGAPADVVQALLDADLRARLLELKPVELTIANGTVSLAKEGWIEDGARAQAFLALVLDVAERVPRAFGEADAKLEAQGARGPAYREEPDAAAARAAKAARQGEVQRLAEVRDARRDAERRRAFVVLAVIGIGLVGLLALDLVLASR